MLDRSLDARLPSRSRTPVPCSVYSERVRACAASRSSEWEAMYAVSELIHRCRSAVSVAFSRSVLIPMRSSNSSGPLTGVTAASECMSIGTLAVRASSGLL